MALRLASKINCNILHNITRRSLVAVRQNTLIEEEPVEDETCAVRLSTAPENDYQCKSSMQKQANCKSSMYLFKGCNCTNADQSLLEVPCVCGACGSCGCVRHYSSKDDKKCKKLEVGKAECKKFRLCNCDQVDKLDCLKQRADVECVKREAPYPCFSETCYEEPYNKPSECKMCPWKPRKNPNFKLPTKEFHTKVVMKRPMTLKEKFKFPFMPQSENTNPPLDKNYEFLNSLVMKDSPKTGSNMPHDQIAAEDNEKIECTTQVNPKSKYYLDDNEEKTNWPDNEDEVASRFIKFPFKPETYQIGRPSKPPMVDKCKKKKRKLVIDCPLDKRECISNSTTALSEDEDEIGVELPMKNVIMFDEKKCPKLNHDKCEEPKDQCKKPRRPSQVCPDDLIKKSGWPPKKPKIQSASILIVPPHVDKARPAILVRPSSSVSSVNR